MADPKKPTTRDGRYVVVKNTWDYNGSHHVTVVDTHAPVDEVVPPCVIARERRIVRDLARRADPRPDDVQWVRTNSVDLKHTDQGTRIAYHLTVSRLDSIYR